MKCQTIRTQDGGVMIVCGRGPRTRQCQEPGCTSPGRFQCDFEVQPGKTCDRYICAHHAKKQGPNRDYCPAHAR